MKKSFAILISILSLFGCGNNQESTKLVVATSADNPPYELVNNNEIVGFDIDLVNEIAKEMNKTVEIKNLDFGSLLPALSTNNVDMVIAGISVTEERKKNVDFSDSYVDTQMAVLYTKDVPVFTPIELKDKIIGVQFGTTWEEYVKKLVKDIDCQCEVKSLPSNLGLIQELLNDNIDFMMIEKIQAEKFLAEYPKLNFIDLPETKTEFAIVLPKNSPITQKVNEVLKKLKDKGRIEKLKKKWLTYYSRYK